MSPHCCRPVRFYAQHPPVDDFPPETQPRQGHNQLSEPFVPQAKNKTSGVDAFKQRKTKAKTPLFCWRQRKTAYIDILLLPSQKRQRKKADAPAFFLWRFLTPEEVIATPPDDAVIHPANAIPAEATESDWQEFLIHVVPIPTAHGL